MGTFKDLTGKKFTRLTVIKRARNKNKKVMWDCVCNCGYKTTVEAWSLTAKLTKSCGCLNKEIITKYKKINYNGKLIPITSHPLFPIYHGIKNRCYNKNLPNYHRWGGRGIRMSLSWKNSFLSFVNDMGERPTENHSIERKNNNKGYSKYNCIWATAKEQNNNQRSNINLTYKKKSRTLAQWAEILNMKYSKLYARINRGWSIERAFGK